MNELQNKISEVANVYKLKIKNEEKNLITDYLLSVENFQNADEMQKRKFIYDCIVSGANPLKKEIYAIPFKKKIKNGNNWIEKIIINTIFSYHFLIKKAHEKCLENETILSINDYVSNIEKGPLKSYYWNKEKRVKELKEIKDRTGIIECLGKCEITITDKKTGFKSEFKSEVLFSEYNKRENMWLEKPHTMIKKVAVKHALDRAFPIFANFKIEEEMKSEVIDDYSEKSEYIKSLKDIVQTAKNENIEFKGIREKSVYNFLMKMSLDEVKKWEEELNEKIMDKEAEKIKEGIKLKQEG